MNSIQQLKRLFYEVLKYPAQYNVEGYGADRKRKLTTDAEALEELAAAGYDIPGILHEFRKLGKLKGTYVDGILERLTWNNRIHTDLVQAFTLTGRLSSRDPNLQNGFDDETQVLTPHGWVYLHDLDDADQVAQWDDTGIVSFVVPTAHVRRDYEGPVVRVRGESVNLLLAPDHGLVSRQRSGALCVEPVSTWYQRWGNHPRQIVDRRLIRGGERGGGRRLSQPERELLEQAVCTQAEGYVRRDCARIEMRVSGTRKKRQLLELFKGRVLSSSPRYRVWMTRDDPCLSWLRFPEKVFDEKRVLALCADDLRFFLRCVHRWDGDFTRECTYLQHERRLDAVALVQAVAVLTGHSTKWYEANRGRHCVVNIHRSAERWGSRLHITQQMFSGQLHCLAVPTGKLLVRRNAAVIVCRTGGVS
jgi:hypothetical protein